MKFTSSDWKGCGECDPSFPCGKGRQRCIRLEPLDSGSALNDAIDMIVDLGTAIDEGIEGRIFGKTTRVMELLSLRSRKLLSRLTSGRKALQAALPKEGHGWEVNAAGTGVCQNGLGMNVDGGKLIVSGYPHSHSPSMELPLVVLGGLLNRLDIELVSMTQNEADRAQVLASFDEDALISELLERSRRSKARREALLQSKENR